MSIRDEVLSALAKVPEAAAMRSISRLCSSEVEPSSRP